MPSNTTNVLTDNQYLILSEFSYLDFIFNKKDEINYKGKSFKEIATKLLTDERKKEWYYEGIKGGNTAYEFELLLQDVIEDETLGNLIFKDIEDDNDGTGFVGYAFEHTNGSNGTKDVIFAFRGSETTDVKNITENDTYEGIRDFIFSVDWIDNAELASKSASQQFEKVEEFISKVMKDSDGDIHVTGHSKGGANALYACAAIPGVKGTTFDAPGIGQALTEEEIQRLMDSGAVNYVAENDVVGALLFHPEDRKFIKEKDEVIKVHELTNYLEKNFQGYDNYNIEEIKNFIANSDGTFGKIYDESCEIYVETIDGEKRIFMKKEEEGTLKYHNLDILTFDENEKAILGERSEFTKKIEEVSKIAYATDQNSYHMLDDVIQYIIGSTKEFDSYINARKSIKEALSDIKADMEIAIRNNVDSAETKINHIIETGSTDIKNNLENIGSDIDVIKKEIGAGIDDINIKIQSTINVTTENLLEDINSISSSFDRIKENMSIDKALEDLKEEIESGEGFFKSIFSEGTDRLKGTLAELYSIKNKALEVKYELIDSAHEIISDVCIEASDTALRIKDEVGNIIINTIEIDTTISSGIQKIKETIAIEFAKTLSSLVVEIVDNSDEFLDGLKHIGEGFIHGITKNIKLISAKLKYELFEFQMDTIPLIKILNIILDYKRIPPGKVIDINSSHFPGAKLDIINNGSIGSVGVIGDIGVISGKVLRPTYYSLDASHSISVNLSILEDKSYELKRISRGVGSIQHEFSRIENTLDSDVKQRQGIAREMRDISREIDRLANELNNASFFLKESEYKYQQAERKIGDYLSSLNINTTSRRPVNLTDNLDIIGNKYIANTLRIVARTGIIGSSSSIVSSLSHLGLIR